MSAKRSALTVVVLVKRMVVVNVSPGSAASMSSIPTRPRSVLGATSRVAV